MGNLYFSVGRDAPHPSYLEIEMFILFGTVNGGRELYDSLMYMSAPEVEKQILLTGYVLQKGGRVPKDPSMVYTPTFG